MIWKLCHHVIAEYRQAHHKWVFVKHGVLLNDPIDGFKGICAQTSLEWDTSYRDAIMNSISSDGAKPKDPLYQCRSREEVMAQWQKLLGRDEYQRIRSATDELVAKLYTKDELKRFML